MDRTWQVWLVIAAFLIITPIFWTRIIYLMARLSGWLELAKLYPGPASMQGEVCRYSSARFRMFVSYNRNLTITLSPAGIHIRPMMLFRTRHMPLLIPWEAVIKLEQKGLALFPMLDATVKTDDPARPAMITFYGRQLVGALQRHGESHAA